MFRYNKEWRLILMKTLMRLAFCLAVISVFVLSGRAWATMDQAKLYKEAFGVEKPKCAGCHVDKLPKKDDGKHALNEYGKKLTAVKEVPDLETYKQVGANDKAEE